MERTHPARCGGDQANADRLFYSVAPLFSEQAMRAYQDFVAVCFSTHNRWGADAHIRSGCIRRHDAAREAWRPEWEELFTHQESDQIEETSMAKVQANYNKLLAALVEDVQLLAPRDRYADSADVINAR